MSAMIIVNPGTGPVADATEENAIENMKHFIVDCNCEGLSFARKPDLDYGEGRFAFLLKKGQTSHEIQMPGLPLSQVRYINSVKQNIWDFPRLYVDDDSWVWLYAIDIICAEE